MAHLRHTYRTLHRPEMRIRQRDINGLQGERMAHLPPVGGDHIGCGRQASCATELSHHFTPGETLLRTTRIFCISQRPFQVFTNFNRFVQRPAPLGSSVIRACGKRCASATIDSASSSPASTPPFSLKSLKPYFSYAASARRTTASGVIASS